MITLVNGSCRLELFEGRDDFYQGTRFDRSGLPDSVQWEGVEMAGRWFERYDPFLHDAVCGPAEEFDALGFGDAAPGQAFIKPGVGLLRRPDEAPYDRFRLYEIIDPGSWEVESGRAYATFRQTLKGAYEYTKQIVLTGPDSFEIRHSFASEGLSGQVYNHNFWTFSRYASGPSRTIDFAFRPEGDWRSAYDSVGLTASGIRFCRELQKGESVYMGNIHSAGAQGSPYAMALGEGDLRIEISADVPALRTVFWANHRVACLEPYNSFGPLARWTIKYRFSKI